MIIDSLNDLASVRAYLMRISAEPRSLLTAVIKEMYGNYWRDTAIIRFHKDGSVECPDPRFEPTDAERDAIKAEFANVTWPQLKKLARLNGDVPEMVRKADPKDVFEFRDENDQIIMLQVRIEVKGERHYVPWTYWDDGRWRSSEPDGKLPLWGLENLKDATTVFVHEGAKAARRMQRMIEKTTEADKRLFAAHPWARELSGAVHLGWIGGALSPGRTDWSALARNGVKRVYIIADNDAPGRAAVPAVSQQIQLPTFMIQFTDEFPGSFDLGDDFPEHLFREMDGSRHYVGPAFRDCLHPATWATNLIPNPKGKPTAVLRESFRNMWAYVEEADVFVCTEMPEILRTESVLNKMLSSFSHSSETSKLIVKSYRGRSARLCYRPDQDGLTVTFRGSSAINLHVKSTIRARPGNPQPWLDFLEYMFINPRERHQVMRWCATLIARPEIRMNYGMLLVSAQQGTGKQQPLHSKILTPSGWKTMGEMKVGTEICSASGGKQTVVGVFPQGIQDVMEVTFSDGQVVEAGPEHNWLCRYERKFWSVKTTKEIQMEIALGKKIYVPTVNPILFEEKNLPIDPYTLGALIGDGALTCSSVTISIPDDKTEIIEKISMNTRGQFFVEKRKTYDGVCPRYYIGTGNKTSPNCESLKAKLNRIGLSVKSGDRFIPDDYKFSSINQRTELLRGLMDTDGSAREGRTSFSTTSERLANDVRDVVLSLSGAAYVHKNIRKTKTGFRTEYHVNVRMSVCPFSLSRKANRWRPANKEYGTRIVSVSTTGQTEQQCIAVSSPDKLYVTDGFKVTHNTLLSSNILGQLVGPNNVGYPSESDINSTFNDWMANKRLVVVNEIYSGHSWKAYNAMKSVITDKDISVNQKYMRPYTIENWCHVIACSNSLRALKMENDDRRWLYPEITEVPWDQERFNVLRRWINNGGLSIIRHWAEGFGDYVSPAERAPMTDRKRELIEGSRSEAQQEAIALAEAVRARKEPVALVDKEVVEWVKQSVNGRVFDTGFELRKAMTDAGLRLFPARIRVSGRLQHVLMNDACADAIQRVEEEERIPLIRSMRVAPTDIVGTTM